MLPPETSHIQQAAAPAAQLPVWVELIKALAWPTVALVAFVAFRERVLAILRGLEKRIDAGAAIKIYSVEVGQAPINLPAPSHGEIISGNHLALIHSSWRYPKKDAEFRTRMWAFHAVIQARPEVLDQIEYVKYLLDKSYPNPVQVVTDRLSRFKLKELANGESTLRAEVKIKGQDGTILLSRYVNLTETGPRI